MNILSLFGGIECGRVALDNLGVTPNNYFSCEMNPNSIEITKHNFPDIIHVGNKKNTNVKDLPEIGDVKNVKAADLPKIDLILAGFPCTDLSRAGRQNGFYGIYSLEQYLYLKANNHKFKGQSYLFWEFVRLLTELKPKYFLLENVIMPARWQRLITNTLQLEPFYFNSSDFSGQSRERLYWTNLKIEVPNIISNLTVKDFLDSTVDDRWLEGNFIPVGNFQDDYYHGIKGIGGLLKEDNELGLKYLTLNDFRTGRRVYSINGKCPTMTTGNSTIFKIGDRCLDERSLAPVGDAGSHRFRALTILEKERLQGLPDGYTKVPGMKDGPRSFGIGNGWTVPTIEHLLKNLI